MMATDDGEGGGRGWHGGGRFKAGVARLSEITFSYFDILDKTYEISLEILVIQSIADHFNIFIDITCWVSGAASQSSIPVLEW